MLQTLKNLIIAALLAFWVGAIAIFSIQNITAVSLKFLLWQTIKLPVGVLLAFAVGGGLMIGSLLPLLWKPSKSPRKRRLRTQPEDMRDFDFDFEQ
ncbi:MAG: LapA family protein [Crocosphaera sp.]